MATLAIPLPQRPRTDAAPQASNAKGVIRAASRWRTMMAITLVLVGGLALIVAAVRGPAVLQRTSAAAAEAPALVDGVPLLPADPVDGVLTLTIPRGAAADQALGGVGYRMPSVISLKTGDKIVIHNDDVAPHMILYAFIKPGETQERTFTDPGSEVYSSGCGLHAAAFLNFTTIFVSDPA